MAGGKPKMEEVLWLQDVTQSTGQAKTAIRSSFTLCAVQLTPARGNYRS